MNLLKTFTFFLLSVTLSSMVAAQGEEAPASLAGAWDGTLVIGRDSYDMTFTFTREQESFGATLISRKLGIYGMPAESVKLTNNRLIIRLDILAAEYTGRLRFNDDGTEVAFIDGEWFQEGEMVPIILRRPDSQ